MNNLYFIIIVDNNIIDTISITAISKEKAKKKFLKYLCYIYSVDKDDIEYINNMEDLCNYCYNSGFNMTISQVYNISEFIKTLNKNIK